MSPKLHFTFPNLKTHVIYSVKMTWHHTLGGSEQNEPTFVYCEGNSLGHTHLPLMTPFDARKYNYVVFLCLAEYGSQSEAAVDRCL